MLGTYFKQFIEILCRVGHHNEVIAEGQARDCFAMEFDANARFGNFREEVINVDTVQDGAEHAALDHARVCLEVIGGVSAIFDFTVRVFVQVAQHSADVERNPKLGVQFVWDRIPPCHVVCFTNVQRRNKHWAVFSFAV